MKERDAICKMLIRVPPDLKMWLEQEAARNLSSQSSEIVRSIRARKEAEQALAGT
jgi:hypothetical protein